MTVAILRKASAVAHRAIAYLLLLSLASVAFAQPAAFTYQGKLSDAGSPANGNYDLQFKLFDNVTVGSGTQYASTIVVNPVAVSAGIFTVTLNFGPGVFGSTGVEVPDMYLEIGVRPAGSAVAYTIVSPRQKITSSPYTIEAINTTFLGGVHASRFVQSDANGNVGVGTSPSAASRLTVLSFGGSATYSECPPCTGVQGKSTSGIGVYGTSNSFEGVRGESSSASSAGVVGYNLSNGGFGVFGSSPAGAGVQGNSTSGNGVVGGSADGSGVYGTTSFPNSLTHAGVYGVGTGAGSIGVHGTSDNANAVGVFGDSLSTQGYGVYARAFNGRAIWADGNAGQDRDHGGIVKAMAYVLADSTIPRCYNSQLLGAPATTPPCGFTATRLCGTGGQCYTAVNFGFKVDDRFWSATVSPNLEAGGQSTQNRGINVRAYINSLHVTMFVTTEPSSTDYATPFMLIVY